MYDKDERVQLIAAVHLRLYGNKKAEQILIKHFTSSNPQKRFYALTAFWQFKKLEKIFSKKDYKVLRRRMLKHVQKLRDAIRDNNDYIKRFAILQLGHLKDKKSMKLMSKYLKSKNTLLRFQTTISVSRMAPLEKIKSILSDRNMALLFRTAVLLGLDDRLKKIRKNPMEVIFFISALVEDPDPRMKILIFTTIAKRTGKGGIHILKDYLNSNDPKTRFATICAIAMGNYFNQIPKIIKFLNDSDKEVQSSAGMALTSLAGKFDRKKLEQIHNIIKKSSPSAARGGADGYLKILHDSFVFIPEAGEQYRWHKAHIQFVDQMVKVLSNWNYYYRKWNRKRMPAIDSIDVLLQYMNKSIELNNYNSRAYFKRALIYYAKRQYLTSLQDMKKAMKLEKLTTFTLWLAKIYFKANQYKNALITIDKFLEKFPWDYRANILKAKILQVLGHKKDAYMIFQQAALIKQLDR